MHFPLTLCKEKTSKKCEKILRHHKFYEAHKFLMLMLVFYDFMNDSVSALYYRGILWANVLGLFMRSENVMLINMVFFLFTLPFDYFYHIIVIIIILLTLRKYIYIYIYMYKYVLCVYLYIHTYLYIARSPC